MSLRQLLIAASLIATPVATLSLAPAAFANTADSSVTLTGTVPSMIAITTAPTTAATDLPLGAPGVQTTKIADVNITSNNTAGITITASSTNNSVFQSQTNAADSVTYQVAIVNGGVTPSSFVNVSNLSQSETTGFNATTGIKSMDLYVKINNPSLPKRGTYTDTITLTVADN